MLGATVGYLGPAFGCCKGGAWSPGCIFGCCPAREVVDATVGSLGAVLGAVLENQSWQQKEGIINQFGGCKIWHTRQRHCWLSWFWWWSERFGDGSANIHEIAWTNKSYKADILLFVADNPRKQQNAKSQNVCLNFGHDLWQCPTMHRFPNVGVWLENSFLLRLRLFWVQCDRQIHYIKYPPKYVFIFAIQFLYLHVQWFYTSISRVKGHFTFNPSVFQCPIGAFRKSFGPGFSWNPCCSL